MNFVGTVPDSLKGEGPWDRISAGRAGVLAVLLCLSPLGALAATFNVTTYGAVGDGATDNTTAIQDAINAASAAGGGTVLIPAATASYLSNALTLDSDIDLSIAAGAELQMEPYGIYDGGSTAPPNFITGSKLTDVIVNGGGTIDGQGLAWWNAYIASNSVVRPGAMLYITDSQNVTVTAITLQNAPMVNQQYFGDTNVLISNETVFNPYDSASDNISPNTDGMDVASENVLIENCNISTGDDVIAIGSSSHVAQNITVTGCTFGTGHGLSIGSHTDGGVNGLFVSACTFTGTQYGLRFKSDRGNGGLATNLYYSDLTMTGIVYYPIFLDSYYGVSPAPTGPTDDPGGPATLGTGTPQWQNVSFTNIVATTASGAKGPMQLWGLPEAKATDFLFDDVRLTGPGSAEIYHAASVSFTCTCLINGAAPSAANVTTSDATVAFLTCAPSPSPSLTPALTATPNPSGTWTKTPTPQATPTLSDSPSGTPSAIASATPSSSRTSTRTPTSIDSATATATVLPPASPSPTLSPKATESPTGTSVASVTASATATVASSTSPTPGQTASQTASPSLSSTPSLSATVSLSPSLSPSLIPSSSPTPSAVSSGSPTLTLSPSASPSLTPTPSPSTTESNSPSPIPSESKSTSPSVTGTPTGTISDTATPTPSDTLGSGSPVETTTPTLRDTAIASTATATPPVGGQLAITRALPVPNPNPVAVAVDLDGPVDGVDGILFSAAEVAIEKITWGPQAAGWNSLPLPATFFQLPKGLYYLKLQAERGNATSAAVVVKMVLLR
jgi:hypothetical protein